MRMLRISPPIRMILYSSDDLKQMSFNRLKSVIRHLIGVLCEQDKKDILNWAKASWKSDINVDDVSTVPVRLFVEWWPMKVLHVKIVSRCVGSFRNV